jgi:hypothetical protein
MPQYQNLLNEQRVLQLVAYIKTLKQSSPTGGK